MIILNSTPPALMNTPKAAFGILKSFLSSRGFSTRVKYWDNILKPLTAGFGERLKPPFSEYSNELIPFLYYLAKKNKDIKAVNRLARLFLGLCSQKELYSAGSFEEVLEDFSNKVFRKVKGELGQIDFDRVTLWGCSFKFHQWISGLALTDAVKRSKPEVKTVIGGFGLQEEALNFMSLNDCFDFAIWGEGEYPLLELCREIEKNDRNLENIPRLIYRENGQLKTSRTGESEFVSFGDDYPFPDFEEYYETLSTIGAGIVPGLPINGVRGCYWNRCKFCVLNQGYTYRERSPENIVAEIEYQAKRHHSMRFHFADNDLKGRDKRRFEMLLDLLIESSQRNGFRYQFSGDINPLNVSEKIVRKMAAAGFISIQIGFEANCDSLLKKMNKMHGYADNLQFTKFAGKYGIKMSGMNILSNIPEETEEEVFESTDNLQYLRFFLDENCDVNFCPLTLHSGAPFETYYTQEEKDKKWILSDFFHFLPEYLKKSDRFALSEFTSLHLENIYAWYIFIGVKNYYLGKRLKHRFSVENNEGIFEELVDGKLTKTLFLEPILLRILKGVNEVCSLERLQEFVVKEHPGTNLDELKNFLSGLQEEYLVYCNDDYTKIVSIIDYS